MHPEPQNAVPSTKNHAADSDPEQLVSTPRALILGGGDIASAVAHLLHRKGLQVVLADKAGSGHARRGMAFTDAQFDGHAMLDGVEARWVKDCAGIEACWREGVAIPLATMPEHLLTAAFRFDICVEATMRRYQTPPDVRALAPTVVGIGPGYVPDVNCHMAIETQWGSRMGEVLRDRAPAQRSGGPRALDGITRERFAVAPAAGIWRTAAQLGQAVVAGEVVGQLGGVDICAPINGRLRGLSRDGVEVMTQARLVEVDPREVPQIFGLGERPVVVARGVAHALGLA
jgi:xanthine dehydrogenase accessory factor